MDNKDTETGCTLHECSEEVDAGKILLQKKIHINPDNETPDTLKDKGFEKQKQTSIQWITKIV